MRRTAFARERADAASFAHVLCRYERPLICYPGQEAAFAGKRSNVALALSRIHGVVLRPGETFSFWRAVGRPTSGAGYLPAAAIREGALIEEIGGALCLVSTLLYNIGLLAGLTIVERYCHSVDSYGERRYFELGRDAAVEYAYRDLRFRNDWDEPLLLGAYSLDDAVVAEARAQAEMDMSVDIEVEVEEGPPSEPLVVHTTRRVTRRGVSPTEDLGLSIHARQH